MTTHHVCDLLRWSASIRGVFEGSYPSLCEKQCNASNIILEWLEDPRIVLQDYWDSKSLAQVWICSKEKIMQCWNPKFEKIKVWQRWSDSKLKWMKCVSYLILSIGMPYYQEGCNIDYLTRSKILIDNPWEDPERKPLRTNIEILEWSSLDLMDQVGSYKQGFGVLWP